MIKVAQNTTYDTNWKLLYGLMLSTVYGGRIDNDVDMRLMDVYLRDYFNPEIEKGKRPIFSNINIVNIPKLL